MTQTEKALKIIAKQIKELDKNAILLSEVDGNKDIFHARKNLYNLVTRNGYTLEIGTYKLLKK